MARSGSAWLLLSFSEFPVGHTVAKPGTNLLSLWLSARCANVNERAGSGGGRFDSECLSEGREAAVGDAILSTVLNKSIKAFLAR